MASRGGRGGNDADLQVNNVVVDALVVMKVLKHARENPHEPAQGPLLGLVMEGSLDVTNCFPLPQVESDDDNAEATQYQVSMMRWLRDVNVDHMQVGWYQVAELGSFFDETVASVQFAHQSQIEESVVLVYDPVSTSHGSLSLRAFRLTPEAMQLFDSGDFSSASLKRAGLSFKSIFAEVPVVLRMSPLARALVPSLTSTLKQSEEFDRLDLSPNVFMEKNIHRLMEAIDELAGETQKYQQYHRQIQKKQQEMQQYQQRRQAENATRIAQGQEPLPEEDLEAVFKLPHAPSRLDSLLITAQINQYCRQVSEHTRQSFCKLYVV
jgi:translation initiation factor 3 subunit H